MNHLSDDLIHTLAIKVANESDLTLEEEKALMHVPRCDECYHLLCCTMAMHDVIQNIGALAVNAPPVEADQHVQKAIQAVLRLAVGAVNSVLDQVDAGVNEWTFHSAPMALLGTRSSRRRSAVKKLTDEANSKTFVAYDPDKKLLVIQIDAVECPVAPTASLKLSDGTRATIPLEKKEHLYLGTLSGLDDGDYEIILEK